MVIQEKIPLSRYSTMRVGGLAAYLAELTNYDDLKEAIAFASQKKLPVIMIGDGTNIVWRDEGFKGLVLVNKIMGFDITSEDDSVAYITIGAGENWDSVVKRTVERGLNGIAELSLIPGTTGATPIQNVGAYGKEISDVLLTVEAYDIMAGRLATLTASDCKFGYRTSRFKKEDHGKFLITRITIMLTKDKPTVLHESVAEYLKDNGISQPGVSQIRDAVVAIRSAKLPDPKVVANNGSFFANPVIEASQLNDLLLNDPTIKYWHLDSGKVKLSAAWLIESCGFKGVHDQTTGMTTWPTQPLVLVNEHAKNTADVLAFRDRIAAAVQQKFGIALQQEPELLP